MPLSLADSAVGFLTPSKAHVNGLDLPSDVSDFLIHFCVLCGLQCWENGAGVPTSCAQKTTMNASACSRWDENESHLRPLSWNY